MSIRGENVKMVGKLAVVAAGMFAFGYALIPIYKHICEMTGINILSLSERQVPGGGRAGADVQLQHAGRHQPHHHRGVRRQRARAVGVQAGAALDRRCIRASWRP